MKKSYRKYTIFFSILTASAFIICWGANALLLSRFYVSKMESRIELIYEQLESASSTYGVESESFAETFISNTETFGCDILVLDQEMGVVASNTADVAAMKYRLLSYFFNKDTEARVINQTEKYTMVISSGDRVDEEYVELWGTLSNGSPILISSAVSGMNENAKLATLFFAYVGLVAILVSFILVIFISRNLTLSSELRKREEMDEMRKEFVSNVSHELKTPIALIQGYAEGLSDCVNDDDESREFYCEVIIDEAQKMNRLVKNLLDLNELELGHANVDIEEFNITELLYNCVQSVDIMLKQNDINLEFDSSKDVIIRADEFLIERVVNNYLSNAIHYASGEEKRIVIKMTEKADKVRVSVFNSGNHIPDDALPKIWTKFYKYDKARTREYGGSGVGLSIVKAAMESLNQKYGCKNVDGGVEFFFEAEIKKV